MSTGFSERPDRNSDRSDRSDRFDHNDRNLDHPLDQALPLRDRDLDPWGDRLRLFVYLAPFVGFGLAAVDLLRGEGDRRRRAVARRSVGLAVVWLLGYGLLNLGGDSSAPLLLLNSVWTSGYVLICVMGMVSRWRGTSIRLGRLGDWSEELGSAIAGPSAQPPGISLPLNRHEKIRREN